MRLTRNQIKTLLKLQDFAGELLDADDDQSLVHVKHKDMTADAMWDGNGGVVIEVQVYEGPVR